MSGYTPPRLNDVRQEEENEQETSRLPLLAGGAPTSSTAHAPHAQAPPIHPPSPQKAAPLPSNPGTANPDLGIPVYQSDSRLFYNRTLNLGMSPEDEDPQRILDALSVGPSPLEYWQKQHALIVSWLIVALVAMVLFLPLGALGLIGQIAVVPAIVGASLHTFTCIKGMDLRTKVRMSSVIGYLSCALSIVMCIIVDFVFLSVLSLDELKTHPQHDELKNMFTFLGIISTIILGVLAYVSFLVGSRSSRMLQLMNPVTSGIIQLS